MKKWQVTEEPTQAPLKRERRNAVTLAKVVDSVRTTLFGVHSSVKNATTDFAKEGVNQYHVSFKDFHSFAFSIVGIFKAVIQGFWKFLTQPVWVMQKKDSPKKYSRGTLFVLDTVRFGGTFAAIFVALFVSLNYQSFWKIVTPYLDPLDRVQRNFGQQSEIDDALKEKLLRSPTLATAGKEEGNLLSYLPTIGPPENRIIIPRLGLNVPLVTPSFESLLQEDWEGVEEDIQDALQYGVVHYPGTARPGQAGNFFVTGHSSYYPWAPGAYKTVFARMHEIQVGDEYWVYYGGDKHRYVVGGKKEVNPSDVSVLDQPTNRRVATLMTCTPVGTTLRRLILTAQEVDPITGVPMQVGQQETRVRNTPAPQALPI